MSAVNPDTYLSSVYRKYSIYEATPINNNLDHQDNVDNRGRVSLL